MRTSDSRTPTSGKDRIIVEDDLLDRERFVELLIDHVRAPAIEGTVATLKDPPGRAPNPQVIELSAWFNGLAESDRAFVTRAMTDAVDSALFGFLCMLDGARSVNPQPGMLQRLVLRAELDNGREQLLSTHDEPEELHDIYNWLTREQSGQEDN
jgi:hypothetical protein